MAETTTARAPVVDSTAQLVVIIVLSMFVGWLFCVALMGAQVRYIECPAEEQRQQQHATINQNRRAR